MKTMACENAGIWGAVLEIGEIRAENDCSWQEAEAAWRLQNAERAKVLQFPIERVWRP
jgi:hypothetical protein